MRFFLFFTAKTERTEPSRAQRNWREFLWWDAACCLRLSVWTRTGRTGWIQAAGVDAAAAVVIDGAAEETELKRMTDKLRYPLFVKPVKAGSSYGITKVSAPEDLFDAVVLALEYDDQVIIEENICGFEVGCAVLGNRFLKVGEVDEIELSDGF